MIIIDYGDKRPIYEQIAERFRILIMSGVLEADEKLPSVRMLAVELSINPNTIQRAFGLLEQEGLVYAVKGKGNFVKKDESFLQRQRDQALRDFEEQVQVCLSYGIKKEELLSQISKTEKEEEA